MPTQKLNLRTRDGMARWILNVEARRDAKGQLKIYRLPKGDGGGTYEVAGLNDRYHPEAAAHAAALIKAGRHDDAERYVTSIIAEYTDPAARWILMIPAVEFFVRDCIWNRGPRGAAKILQISLELAGIHPSHVDGWVGDETLKAIWIAHGWDRSSWVRKLRAAREAYERRVAPPVGERAKFWKGLISRFDAAEEAALSMV